MKAKASVDVEYRAEKLLEELSNALSDIKDHGTKVQIGSQSC